MFIRRLYLVMGVVQRFRENTVIAYFLVCKCLSPIKMNFYHHVDVLVVYQFMDKFSLISLYYKRNDRKSDIETMFSQQFRQDFVKPDIRIRPIRFLGQNAHRDKHLDLQTFSNGSSYGQRCLETIQIPSTLPPRLEICSIYKYISPSM